MREQSEGGDCSRIRLTPVRQTNASRSSAVQLQGSRDVFLRTELSAPVQEQLVEILLMLDAEGKPPPRVSRRSYRHYAYGPVGQEGQPRVSIGGRLKSRNDGHGMRRKRIFTMTLPRAPGARVLFPRFPVDHLHASARSRAHFSRRGVTPGRSWSHRTGGKTPSRPPCWQACWACRSRRGAKEGHSDTSDDFLLCCRMLHGDVANRDVIVLRRTRSAPRHPHHGVLERQLGEHGARSRRIACQPRGFRRRRAEAAHSHPEVIEVAATNTFDYPRASAIQAARDLAARAAEAIRRIHEGESSQRAIAPSPSDSRGAATTRRVERESPLG